MSSSFWLPTAPASDKKAMRDFALGFSFMLCLFFVGLLPWFFSTPIPYWPMVVSAMLIVGGLTYSPSVYPVYRVWMVFASIMVWINNRIIMLFAFYVLIFPIGIVLQLLNKLQYKKVRWPVASSVNTYWIKRENSPTKENLKEPF